MRARFATEYTGPVDDQADWVARHTSLGRPGAVEELVGPVLFLASEASTYVTAQTLAVDGGWI